MTITSITGLDAAVATYVAELVEPDQRSRLVQLLAPHREDRQRRFGHPQERTRTALRLLAPFTAPDGEREDERSAAQDVRFIRWTRTLVRSWLRPDLELLRAYPAADPDTFVDRYLEDQVALVSETLVRTLVEVLAERRQSGVLSGTTPQARFADFRVWIGSPEGAAHLAHRFPAAVVRAHGMARRRSRSVREILDHFRGDLPDLREVFPALGGDVRIHGLTLGAGDGHDGGRTVGILDLGSHGRLVFKPRNLAADRAFEAVARTLDDVVGTSLRVPRTLSRTHHGWAELIEPGPNREDARYPYRLGELAAVLHVLRSTDMHYENVVTDTGGRPVVVDAETILTPAPLPAPTYADGAGSRHVQQLLEESVLGTGLLPLRVSVPGRAASLDIGASGSIAAGQVSPFRSLSLRDVGRDDMHIALEPGRVGAGNANPHPPRAARGLGRPGDRPAG